MLGVHETANLLKAAKENNAIDIPSLFAKLLCQNNVYVNMEVLSNDDAVSDSDEVDPYETPLTLAHRYEN